MPTLTSRRVDLVIKWFCCFLGTPPVPSQIFSFSFLNDALESNRSLINTAPELRLLGFMFFFRGMQFNMNAAYIKSANVYRIPVSTAWFHIPFWKSVLFIADSLLLLQKSSGLSLFHLVVDVQFVFCWSVLCLAYIYSTINSKILLLLAVKCKFSSYLNFWQ